MNKRVSVLRLVPAALSLVMAVGASTFFRACSQKDDGTWMHCHTAQYGAVITAVILFVLFLAAAFIKSRTLFLVLSIAGIAGSIAAFLIPGSIVSMCMMDTMRCHAVMKPFIRAMSVLIILTDAAGFIRR